MKEQSRFSMVGRIRQSPLNSNSDESDEFRTILYRYLAPLENGLKLEYDISSMILSTTR